MQRLFLTSAILFLCFIPKTSYAGSSVLYVNSGTTTLDAGTYSYESVMVSSSGILRINDKVTLNISGAFIVDSGGMVDATGHGYGSNSGPNAGTVGNGAGGGGHIGNGGKGSGTIAFGGIGTDSSIDPQEPGSGGGSSSHLAGGSGGSYLKINAESAILSGAFYFNGSHGLHGEDPAGGSGGGAGGTLWIHTSGNISGTGNLQANGGNGANGYYWPPPFSVHYWSGGGGGGGIIKLCAEKTNYFTGTSSARGGSAGLCSLLPRGQDGTAGYSSVCLWPSPSPTPTTTPTPVLDPEYRVSSLGKSALAPVPARQGDPLCIYFTSTPASALCTLYNSAGELVTKAAFGTTPEHCIQTDTITAGVYLAVVKIIYADGKLETKRQKIIILK